MVGFRIDKDTPDYLTIKRNDLMYLYATNHGLKSNLENIELPAEIYQEISIINHSICQFELVSAYELMRIQKGIRCVIKFKIRKDSALGQYLIENVGKNEIVDYTEYISYKNICDAMLITIVNDDEKMANKITPLVQKQCCGTKEEILKEFPYHEDALNYILENNDFDAYLANRNQGENPIQEAEPFVVYEDGEWAIKNLEEDYVRVPKKA